MKAGVAQIVLHSDIGVNVERVSAYIESAAKLKLDILCFPECTLTGYLRDFHRVPEEEINEALDLIHQRVTENELNVILGTPYFENNRLFNAALLLRSDKSRASYFKNILTEFDEGYFAKGEGSLSFEIGGVRCGILICRDQNSPWLAQKYAAAGVKAIFILAAHYYSPSEAWLKVEKNRALPIARAVENGVYVLKANAVGSQGTAISLGGSLIVSPDGLIVCESAKTGEDIIFYEVR
ncbi:MAG: carbon-nitrogen hydrolase family protein [Chloroflexi bacterium CG07_land_8_20_14_0_80_51_10]|nr:MAG: carbon-nitrogen hydrolase family protein [Chloroflexi bacterium CG07_land_8_20_14_0_80_51_10]